MLARVLDSLAAPESVGRILVCTDETAALPSLLPSGVETVAAAASPSRSILAAVGTSAGGEGPEKGWPLLVRSEEHTSELQSLMRISYAVFCLQKKHRQGNKQPI